MKSVRLWSDISFLEGMVDSTGKSLEYHFGGNYDTAAKMVTGCYMCFDSCPVGIISNASHPTGTAEFHGKEDSKVDEKNSRKMSKGYLAFEMDFVNAFDGF